LALLARILVLNRRGIARDIPSGIESLQWVLKQVTLTLTNFKLY